MLNDLKPYAYTADEEDALKKFRNYFHFPQLNGKPVLYFTGNSLGLQPVKTADFVKKELEKWAEYGVEGHFKTDKPWFDYHKHAKNGLIHLTGGLASEVTAMNALSVNLQLLLVSFYRPKGKKTKIMIESGAFPSDQYAIETQVKWHGLDTEKNIIELTPRPKERTLRTEDILAKIQEHKNELALVMLGGVNYYTGQYFDIPTITQKAQSVGAFCGWDLAHTIGNLPLELHNWNVDFAVWCSYKYLNSGPGGVGGAFVHQKHHQSDMMRLAGWWGYEEKTRFQMKKGFLPEKSVDAWQLSNASILPLAAHLASLQIFMEADIYKLREKSEKLTKFLEQVIQTINQEIGAGIEIITPENPAERGAQLSLIMKKNGKKVFEGLQEQNIIADWREPDVIRIAPVPLYNSFVDILKFGEILKQVSINLN
ncbi:MAG: kynureninase [Bacteroidetes bacterium]|nr:MAG: kynureninase [Bacteroidota bacterium]TAG86447.1 MAG: kynureninase [Bacteroidota bacterium]